MKNINFVPARPILTKLELPEYDLVLYYSTPELVQDDIDLLIDTRDETFEDLIALKPIKGEVLKYPVRHRYSIIDRDSFHIEVSRAFLNIKSGKLKRIQAIDQNGCGASVIFIFSLYFKFSSMSINDSLEAFQRIHQEQNTYDGIEVPKYVKQYSFMVAYCKGITLAGYRKEIQSRTGKNGKLLPGIKRSQGIVRLGEIKKHPLIGVYRKRCQLKDFTNVEIEATLKNEWIKLCPNFLGPVEFYFVTKEGEIVQQIAHDLQILMYSLYVFPEDLDENGELNDAWFTEHNKIIQIRAFIDSHPKCNVNPCGIEDPPPKYVYWEGELIKPSTAYRKVFSPMYAKLARECVVFTRLVSKIDVGINIHILANEGFDFFEEGMTYSDVYNNEKFTWNYGHVLYGMLTKNEIWLGDEL